MNLVETELLGLLKRGRDSHGIVAVKAEFEAEGTRPEEFQRLLEIARRADVKVALKIGGCEAVSDLLASKVYGVDYIIAPMVETGYALSKFVEAKGKTHGPGGQDVQFLFNVETEATLRNLDDMLPIAKAGVDGMVFGRVDFTLSCGLARGQVDDPWITEAVIQAALACAEADLELVVGGSVSTASIPALRRIRQIRLDRFETRKIVFDGSALDSDSAERGLALAVAFELSWLRNKRNYYNEIAREDVTRIAMLEARMASVEHAIGRSRVAADAA